MSFTPSLHYGSPLFKLIPRGVDGITFGRHVFFRSLTPSARLVAHEKEHVRQYQSEGALRFLVLYAWDYVRARLSGSAHREAYLKIRFEVLAREAESRDN